MKVYVAILEIDYEPSSLRGVYSTLGKALAARDEIGEDSIGSVTIYEMVVDGSPIQAGEWPKAVRR